MKIKKVEIEGFRAYKYKKDGTFDFTNESGEPSNFVAIYAPNGFGKSSFYDAVEWAFTDNLERYTNSHDKKNNELAAKGTKRLQVPQKILRNTEVLDDVPTHVSVITTTKKFERKLKKPRSNSSDLTFKATKKSEDVEVYKRVILSQDAIDRFLREAKPQERYDLFMGFFGGSAETLRQEMTLLINENESKIVTLLAERSRIESQLNNPVDSRIFEDFNTLAAALNSQGEAIVFVDENFDTHAEHQILLSIVTRTQALNAERAATQQRHAALLLQLSGLPGFKRNLELLPQQNSYVNSLSKGFQDSVKYQQLTAAHSRGLTEWQSISDELKVLEEVVAQVPSFIADEEVRVQSVGQLPALTAEKNRLTAELKTAETSAVGTKKSIADLDQRALDLQSLIATSPAIYSEIAANEAGLIGLKVDLSDKLTSLQLTVAERDAVASQLNKIPSLPITVDTLLYGDTSYLGLPDDFIVKIQVAHEELAALRLHDQSIKTTQVALTQQMEAVESLVSLGISYLSKWPSAKCPLCRLPHPTSDALIAAVKNNDLLTLVAKQNAQELENIALRIQSLSAEIDSHVGEAQKKHSEHLSSLRQKLNDFSSRVTELESQRTRIAASVDTAERTLKTLKARVWDVDSQELRKRVDAELAVASERRPFLAQQLASVEHSVTSLRNQIQILENQILGLVNLIHEITNKTSYEKVKAFISKEAVAEFRTLALICDRKKAELTTRINELGEQLVQLLGECNELQSIMNSEGNWIDFAVLASNKDEAVRHLNDTQAAITTFVQTVDRLVGKPLGKDPDLIEREINELTPELLRRDNVLAAKIQSFDLLAEQLKAFKPYFDGLKLRDQLKVVEHDLSLHRLVESKLKAERESVVSKLKERVKEFFFTDLINTIYSKIDPHPSFKTVQFIVDFESYEKPGLNIVLQDERGDIISPMLYFSAAQLNILSLSVFLANALHATDKSGAPLDVIMIDDPIQSMDSINVLATIDLLRNVSERFNKQIIISTHDENFFGLLKRKIPTDVFNSKFLQLESFGVVGQG
ncbi:AAA family ATPase [Vibrio furnissii]|uniref:AAA family ATPase n=1 Tax=Vibrio furnissii TaxID=29494 RepID=UPI0013021B59|nr:AAA family ATPase [Vibrio furnissii]